MTFSSYASNQTQADLDGDGRPDLIEGTAGSAPSYSGDVSVLLSSESVTSDVGPPGMLVGIDHALGVTTQISYTATTSTSCYNPFPSGPPPLGGCHATTMAMELSQLPSGVYCEPPMIVDSARGKCLFPPEQLPIRVQPYAAQSRDIAAQVGISLFPVTPMTRTKHMRNVTYSLILLTYDTTKNN